MKRNIGITILGGMCVVVGIVTALFFLLSNFYLGRTQHFSDNLEICYYLALIVGGVGLLKLKNWGRFWVIGQFLLLIIGIEESIRRSILCLLRSNVEFALELSSDVPAGKCAFRWSSDWPKIAFCLLFIYFIIYLLHPKIKNQFK